ncbi:MAG: hypothetical protein RIR04_2420 [Pseudomonadota bacterium]
MPFAQNRIDLVRPDAPDLALFGAYPVGVRTDFGINHNQINILKSTETSLAYYDRPVVIEAWYPSDARPQCETHYEILLRDGKTQAQLAGQALRDGPIAPGRFPLVILSHGYPGNRMLLSHLGENLASKGYVVVSIDHADSTYQDKGAFSSTLYNRPLDTQFALDWLASDHPLAGSVDTDATAIIGYSMGGYGALISGGAGLTEAAVGFHDSPPMRLLARHQRPQTDSRLKAIVPIGAWGRANGYWDTVGIMGLRVPALFMAGSNDRISGYETGIRLLFEQARNTDRCLLTFQFAGHNAAAPIPAPLESWKKSDNLAFIPFDHYADPVWDTTRMNNIAQHYITAFLDLHLKQQRDKASYLGAGWQGFAPETALGLVWERLEVGS